MDSVTSKDVSAVSDWNVEVEEEDERRSLADRCATPLSDASDSRNISPDHNLTTRGGHVAGVIKVNLI